MEMADVHESDVLTYAVILAVYLAACWLHFWLHFLFHISLYYNVNPSSGLPWAPCKTPVLGLVVSRRHQPLTAPPAAGSRKCKMSALARQLQVPAGPTPRCLVLPRLPEQSLMGNVVLADQVICANSGVSDPDTHRDMAWAEVGRG